MLRVFENRELRRIFGPRREELTGGFRKLHNDKLHNLYSLPNDDQYNKDKMSGTCSTHGRDEQFVQNFSRKI
jgi:hypothetical protein